MHVIPDMTGAHVVVGRLVNDTTVAIEFPERIIAWRFEADNDVPQPITVRGLACAETGDIRSATFVEQRCGGQVHWFPLIGYLMDTVLTSQERLADYLKTWCAAEVQRRDEFAESEEHAGQP